MSKNNQKVFFIKEYEEFDLIQNPSMSSDLLKKEITEKIAIFNHGNTNKYDDIFIIYFDSTLVIVNESFSSTIQQFLVQNQISLVYYIPNISDTQIRDQIGNSIQLVKVFFKEAKIKFFLKNQLNNHQIKNKDLEYETILAYLLQKSYIKSTIDRVDNPRKLFQPAFKISSINKNDFINLYELGSGAGGRVYLTYNQKEEKIFAMKIFHEDDYKSEILKKREIHNYEIFCHPFLPRFYGTTENESVVIDYIVGLTLKEIKKMHLDLFEKVIIIFEIMITIQYFHSKGFIYRDLKPDNVIVDHNKNGIIVDFVRIIKESEIKGENMTANFTGNFFAPEIIQKKHFSTKADIYSIGKLIYYIIKEEEADSSNLIFEPDLLEIKDICNESIKEKPDERPEISELIIKMMNYFLTNIIIFENNDFLMEKFWKIIEVNNSFVKNEKIEIDRDYIYSKLSDISNSYNNFKNAFDNHDISMKNVHLHDLLYKFTFFYFYEDIEYDKNFLQLQDESKIIVVDECDIYNSKYSIICFDYK